MLHVTSRGDWRDWLERNHDVKSEVWLVFYKRHTGKPVIPYDDAVEEALCFGWIDSIIKRVDDERYVRKFTPRKHKSIWSGLNKKRAAKMIRKGKMTEAGSKKITEAKNSGEWFKTAPTQKELEIPNLLREALASNKKANANFSNLAKGYRKQFIGWISSAKKEETRKRRLAEALRLLENNEKLGMK